MLTDILLGALSGFLGGLVVGVGYPALSRYLIVPPTLRGVLIAALAMIVTMIGFLAVAMPLQAMATAPARFRAAMGISIFLTFLGVAVRRYRATGRSRRRDQWLNVA